MAAYEDYKAKVAELERKKQLKQSQIRMTKQPDATASDVEKEQVKKTVTKLKNEVIAIDAEIEKEREAFDVVKAERKKKLNPEDYIPKNTPAAVTNSVGGGDKLFDDLRSTLGKDVDLDTIFAEGGLGNTMLVYTGKQDVVAGRPSSGGVKTGKQANVLQLATKLQQSFWTDAATKTKVKGFLAAAGKDSDDLSAFAAWQGVVSTAAAIYNGGNGPELTPFDIMQMQIKNSGGPKKTVDKVDQNVLRSLVENVYSSAAMRKPTPAEMEARLQELNKFVDAGIVTTTSGGTTTRSAGFTQAGAEALIKKKVEKEAPTDVARVRGFEFKDEISSWMRSGI
jgi:hypothetical protein